ncbi:hypothetical protein CTI12_AA563150 [Artemisia annua]|uniref:Anticodon-binding domain-containing protein n=1 Tax=Artemisia annua TaxID=35608 RepID=A0A2U1KUE0_ARTAN|nr:hypothetical protein CTI12_AA563150 [Artemisia annua]
MISGTAEISPSQKLLRLCEFTIAEIEHFVDPKDKSHPKFSTVSNLEFLMLPRAEQMTSQSAKRLCLDDVVAKIQRRGQHDCWDAEIETSCSWIECVGISDRSDFDLRAQLEKSGIALVAQEKYAEPKEVDKCVIRPNKKELGPAFKSHHKMVVEALKGVLGCLFRSSSGRGFVADSRGVVGLGFDLSWSLFLVSPFGHASRKFVTIKRSMVSIVMEKKLEHVQQNRDEAIKRFPFPPSSGPYKCAVFPLVKNKQYEDVAKRIIITLKEAGICLTRYTAGTSIKEKYAYADELGVPFAVTVDSETSVTIRERDSEDLIRVNVAEVAAVVKKLSNGDTTWADISQKYSAHTSGIL